MNSFELSLVTPEREVHPAGTQVVSAILPAWDGYLGIQAHHAPLIAELRPGKLTLRLADGTDETFFLAGGFVEVGESGATIILADAVETLASIDAQRAAKAHERALDRVQRARSGELDIDLARAEAALRRAIARLQLAQLPKH